MTIVKSFIDMQSILVNLFNLPSLKPHRGALHTVQIRSKHLFNNGRFYSCKISLEMCDSTVCIELLVLSCYYRQLKVRFKHIRSFFDNPHRKSHCVCSAEHYIYLLYVSSLTRPVSFIAMTHAINH